MSTESLLCSLDFVPRSHGRLQKLMLRNSKHPLSGLVSAPAFHIHQPFQNFQPRILRGARCLQRRVSLTDALELSEEQRWEEAAVAWQQVLGQVDLPSNLRPQAHCALGDALQKLGQDESAAQHFRLAEGEAWTSAAGFVHVAQLRLANAWRRLGRFGAAERAYRRVFRRCPSAGSARGSDEEISRAVSGAAVMMLRQGKLSKMKRLLETWTCMSPQDTRRADNLLLLLGSLGVYSAGLFEGWLNKMMEIERDKILRDVKWLPCSGP